MYKCWLAKQKSIWDLLDYTFPTLWRKRIIYELESRKNKIDVPWFNALENISTFFLQNNNFTKRIKIEIGVVKVFMKSNRLQKILPIFDEKKKHVNLLVLVPSINYCCCCKISFLSTSYKESYEDYQKGKCNASFYECKNFRNPPKKVTFIFV